MEFKDLVTLWAAPDNTKLTPRQMSIRLPLHVAAKISALCELFPTRTRTEIIGDLLSTALDGVERGLSPEPYPGEASEMGELEDLNPQSFEELIYGARRRYVELVDKYEKEMAVEFAQDQIARDYAQPQTPTPPTPARAKRAPTTGGASAQATTTARPAVGGRGDHRSRKRTPAGGRRSREK